MAQLNKFRVIGWGAAIICVVFVGIQFLRPRFVNPPVTADLQVPAEVKEILRTSCYNCHSNETRLSWFDEPAPAYWIVARDVTEARKHLNFSTVASLPTGQQRGFLFESVSQMELGAMPLPAYVRLHPEAAITQEKLSTIRNYLGAGISNVPSSQTEINAAGVQYDNWIHGGNLSQPVQAAPNGIAFIPDYKNWKAISSTDRSDNGTIREILGNDVALKAIAGNHINPWPDGSAFAKIAWFEQSDEKGFVRTGAFYQVEFMIRDRQKYASTLGWGWARWRGADLKPYGKDANFTGECVGCHAPMRNADYVFTEPIRGEL